MKNVFLICSLFFLISCGESSKSESSKSESEYKLTEKVLTINGKNMVTMKASIDSIKVSLDSVQRDLFTKAWTDVILESGLTGALLLLPEKEKEIAVENFLKNVNGKTAEDIFKKAAKIKDE